jgi:hypothetical protein
MFPLLEELLKLEVFNLDPQGIPIMTKALKFLGMSETRLRVVTLVCRIFLNHLNRIATTKHMTILWSKLLSFIEIYIKVRTNENIVRFG